MSEQRGNEARKSYTNQTKRFKEFPKIDSLLSKSINDQVIPGAVILLTQKNDIIYAKAYGHAQRFEYGHVDATQPEKMTTHHRFDLASLTKVFSTTMGIMLLIDDTKIQLDTPVKKYLTEFSGPHKDSVTIRHLLTHTGGLQEWEPVYYHASTTSEARSHISRLPLKYPVGSQRHYSDLGFMLLGYVIEEVSDMTLQRFLNTRLYHPLGLNNTDFTPRGHTPPFAATSHGNPFERKMVADPDFGFHCDEDPTSFQGWRKYTLVGEVNDGNAFHAHQGVAGHAGLFSSGTDLAVLIELLLQKGAYAGKRYISTEVVEQFLTKDQFGHGLGWAMSAGALPVNAIPEGTFGHTGFTGTFVLAIPAFDASLILLTNRQNMGVQPDGSYHSVNQIRKEATDLFISELKK